jgi:hypothetical protein
MNNGEALGEVISSDSQVLQVECHALYHAPAFGSFVRADCVGSGRSHYAVVTRVSTGPFDGNRIVQAHGMPPGELEQRKPHLTDILRTTFEARIVGYGQDAVRLSGTPPLPAHLHCFVRAAAGEEIRDITRSPNFLRALLGSQDAPLEDLLVCAIQSARTAWGADAPVIAWGKYLARLLRGDYVTFEGVMQRLDPAPRLSPATLAKKPTVATAPRWEEPLPLTRNGSLGDRDPFEEV